MDSHIGGLGLTVTIIASCLVKKEEHGYLVTILLGLHSITSTLLTATKLKQTKPGFTLINL